jgi:hypothetical protein
MPATSQAQGLPVPSVVPVLQDVPGYTAMQKSARLKVALRQAQGRIEALQDDRPAVDLANDLRRVERRLQELDDEF